MTRRDQHLEPMLAVKFLDPLDGQSLVVQQPSHAVQDHDIGGAIKSAPTCPLHGLDETEPSFPEPQYVLGNVELIRRFGDRPEGFGPLGHGFRSPSLGKRAINPRLHHLAGPKADHAPGLDRRRLTGFGIAAHPRALSADLKDAEA